jgi:LCP family protein required for cell wall assembly
MALPETERLTMTFGELGGRRRGRRVTPWVAAVLVCVLTLALLTAYWKFRSVWSSIGRVSVSDLGKRPPKYNSALNLLVFASGSTAGLTRKQQLYWHVGSDAGDAVSETLMIVHISPGRHQVTVVNIPRDTVVPIYSCAKGHGFSGQQAVPGQIEQIDDTLSYGGPACLWKTVEQQTHIRIDHFIEMKYAGVVKVVNDIGGVNVCLPFQVNNVDSGLNLSQGEHHINGVQFLEFWRTRENIGDGSDTQRILRDDYLLARALEQTLKDGLLSSPSKLYHVVTDAAPQLTLDSTFSQSDLLHLGESLRGISGRQVQFVEAPTDPYPANLNWVEWKQPQDRKIFHAIAHDAKLPPATTKSGRPAVLTTGASPSQVQVAVLNGSGVAGEQKLIATGLAKRGFHVVKTTTAPHHHARTVVEYGAATQRSKASAVAAQIPGARVKQVASLGTGPVELILGARDDGLKRAPKPSSAHKVAGLSGKYGGINATANCHSDTGAFSGPLSP